MKKLFLFLIIPAFSYSSSNLQEMTKPIIAVATTGLFAVAAIKASNNSVRATSALCAIISGKVAYNLLTEYSAKGMAQIFSTLESFSDNLNNSSTSSSESDFDEVDNHGEFHFEEPVDQSQSFVRAIAQGVERQLN